MIRSGSWRNAISAALVAWTLAPVAGAQTSALKLATQTVAGTAQYDGAARFAELVARKTDGRVVVTVHGDGALGGDLQVISSLQRGTVDAALMNAGLLNGVSKEFTIFDFPFLFDTEDEAYAVLDGPIGRKLLDLLPPKGIVGLAYPELGFRHVHNSKRAVIRLEDLRGLKIRAVQTPIYVDTLNALGANAVPLPFPDLRHALEKKVVDGATDPLVTIAVMKFDEVQPFLTLTRHVYNAQILLVSKAVFEKLSAADRAALQEAAAEARDFERRLSRERNGVSLQRLRETMRVTQLGADEEAKMRAAVQPVVAKYTKTVGERLVAEFRAEVDKARSRKPN